MVPKARLEREQEHTQWKSRIVAYAETGRFWALVVMVL